MIYENEHMCGYGLVVKGAQNCERIQDKHKAFVSVGSLKLLSKEAHVRDVFKVGFTSRLLQTIRLPF